ncbi:MAG TPA: hypothetical protein DHW82_08010 [Spirochaetia bacterium]|nr:MAG: hypothetical protein A2Y41_06640 [Spirochaetes bacterium GWB1_36_13]HCL56937.1 hypothetical protein [Spirochaetia bacterium]
MKQQRQILIFEEGKVSVKPLKIAQIENYKDAFLEMIKEGLETSFRILKSRPRSEYEIKSNLVRKNFLESEIELIVEELKKMKLVNDAQFVDFFLEGYQKNKPYGEFALRQKLYEKGIVKDLIEEKLTEYYFSNSAEEEAYGLMIKRIDKYKNLSKMEKIKKMTAYLFSRGYEYSVIESVLSRAGVLDDLD